jgi:hypothetical protein
MSKYCLLNQSFEFHFRFKIFLTLWKIVQKKQLGRCLVFQRIPPNEGVCVFGYCGYKKTFPRCLNNSRFGILYSSIFSKMAITRIVVVEVLRLQGTKEIGFSSLSAMGVKSHFMNLYPSFGMA